MPAATDGRGKTPISAAATKPIKSKIRGEVDSMVSIASLNWTTTMKKVGN
jgi:hypothetical protein